MTPHPSGAPGQPDPAAMAPAQPPQAETREAHEAVVETREGRLSRLLSEAYSRAEPRLRARLLECLLRPLRPLGLVAVAAGAFGQFLHRDAWGRVQVPIDQALRYSAEQVAELARFVEQVQPEALAQVATLLADNPGCVATLSSSLLLVALRQWRAGVPPRAAVSGAVLAAVSNE